MQKYTNYDKITLEPIIQLRPAGGHQPGAVLLLRSWLGDSHGGARDGEDHQHGQNDCGGVSCRFRFLCHAIRPPL